MTIMRSSNALLASAGLFMLGALGFLGGAAMLAPSKPAVVASVDLEKVYDSLHRQDAADAELEKLAADLGREEEKKREELRGLEAELDAFKPGSEAHRRLMSQIEEKLVMYKALVEFGRQKIEARRADFIRVIYDDIKATLKVLSKENGWDVVFLDDSIPPLEVADPQRTMQQISARRMLYCSEALDVTEQLVQRMNADFAARGGGAAGSAQPAGGRKP